MSGSVLLRLTCELKCIHTSFLVMQNESAAQLGKEILMGWKRGYFYTGEVCQHVEALITECMPTSAVAINKKTLLACLNTLTKEEEELAELE